jgi:hypothetical protein
VPLEKYTPFGNRNDVRAAFGFVQRRGAPHDAEAVVHELVDHFPELSSGNRVHTNAGLVEQKQLRSPHEGAGETEFLFHPARKIAGQPGRERMESGKLQQSVVYLGTELTDHAPEVGV